MAAKGLGSAIKSWGKGELNPASVIANAGNQEGRKMAMEPGKGNVEPYKGGPAAPMSLTADSPFPTYTGDDAMKESNLKLQERAQMLELKRIKAMQRMGKSVFALAFLEFLNKLMPYLVLFFVFWVIVMGGSAAAAIMRPIARIDAKRRQAFQSTRTKTQRFNAWFRRKFKFLFDAFTPSYRTRMFIRMFMPFKGNVTTIPRQRIYSGRCDNMRWIQMNDKGQPDLAQDGKRGYCFSAIRPKDIEWKLEPSQMPEFNELPDNMKKTMWSKMNIVIPFDSDSTIRDGNTFFVPRCDRAYYKNLKDEKGNNVPAKILEDTGTSCKLASYPFVKGSYGAKGFTKTDFLQRQKW